MFPPNACKALRHLREVSFCVLALWLGFGVAMADSPVPGVDGAFAKLIARCAPTVHPETMAAVISAESRGHQYAIADAGPVKLPWAQRKHLVRSYYMGSLDSAVAKATNLIAAGHTVSLGLAQVNDRNLANLGLSVRAVFDPCTNVAAGGQILTRFYQKAIQKFGPGSRALRASISAYNSGDWMRGENEGYVGLVFKQVGRPLGMRSSQASASASASLVPAIGQAGVPAIDAQTMHKPIGNERAFAMSSSEFVVSD